MATLILTAVGSAIGGPIGGAIGSILGQNIDRNVLFAPKPRQGPRLGELAIQVSSYGTQLPRIFGTMRVSGTVIWATDLIERRATSAGGKGSPKTISYSYSASFAVALSARPIKGIGRIWADGKLLRGVAGDFKSPAKFRLYPGDEDQECDPLIAAAEGLAQTPAFRGLAYAMFEDFQLEDYGNRIPSLSFEVEADDGSVEIGTIARILSDGRLVADATPALKGYAASGDSIRAAIEGLMEIVPLSLHDAGDALRLGMRTAAPVAIASAEESGNRAISRRGRGTVPAEISLVYYDLDRDFQTGLQRATTGPAQDQSSERRALPAVLSAGEAKAFAELRLATLIAGRASAKLSLGWACAGIRPGTLVEIEGESGRWAVRRWTLEAMHVALELQRVPNAVVPGTAAAASGRARTEVDLRHGPTVLRLFDLPIESVVAGRVAVLAAAAGTEPGWRRAALLVSYDGGESWGDAGTTAAPAVMGSAATALGTGQSSLFDRISSFEVELINDAMWLEHASDFNLAAGANLALVGDELIQFGRADWLGDRRFRLSQLLRGRRGTECACGLHAAGEPFSLIERAALATIDIPTSALGGTIMIGASGLGDDEAAIVSLPIRGEALRPPTPVHLGARRLPAGDIMIRWVRRSRLGWPWSGEAETPLGEEFERYQLAIAGDGFSRRMTLDQPSHLYGIASQDADGMAGPIQISVSPVGTYASSRPATLNFE